MNNCLLDLWSEVQPSVCKKNAKGYHVTSDPDAPALIANTMTGHAAVLGLALHLTRLHNMDEQLAHFLYSKPAKLEQQATLAVRRYLFALRGEWYDELPLFQAERAS